MNTKDSLCLLRFEKCLTQLLQALLAIYFPFKKNPIHVAGLRGADKILQQAISTLSPLIDMLEQEDEEETSAIEGFYKSLLRNFWDGRYFLTFFDTLCRLLSEKRDAPLNQPSGSQIAPSRNCSNDTLIQDNSTKPTPVPPQTNPENPPEAPTKKEKITQQQQFAVKFIYKRSKPQS